MFKNFDNQQESQMANINPHLKINQHSPLDKKYQTETEILTKCLPAHFHEKPIYGNLSIKFDKLLLNSCQSSAQRKLIYRCKMLGYEDAELPYCSNEIEYTVHTSCKMFKHYLKDMHTTLVQMFDARNYEPVGHFYVSWLSFMRSVEDNVLQRKQKSRNSNSHHDNAQQESFFFPFLDEQCKTVIPVYDYRVPKYTERQNDLKSHKSKQRIIGEVTVSFSSLIYEKPISQGYLTKNEKNHPSTDQININLNPGSFLDIPFRQQHSRTNSIISSSNTIQNSSVHELQAPKMFKNSSNVSAAMGGRLSGNHVYEEENTNANNALQFENRPSVHQIRKSVLSNSQLSVAKNEKRKGNHQRKSSKEDYLYYKPQKGVNSNEVELLQLKLEAQTLFGNTHKVLQNSESTSKKPHVAILQIIKIKSRIPNVQYLDVFIGHEDKEEQAHKPHLKIYKIESDKLKQEDYFQSRLVIQNAKNRFIEVQLPNMAGRCSFKAKSISENQSKQVSVFSKGTVIGTLTVKNHGIANKNVNQQRVKTEQSQKSPEKIPTQTSEDKFCIIAISELTEKYQKRFSRVQKDEYHIVLKHLKFSNRQLNSADSHSHLMVCKARQLPRVVAFQVRNSSSEIVGISGNIEYRGDQIAVHHQGLMPSSIVDLLIEVNVKQFRNAVLPYNIKFKVCFYISTIAQLNLFMAKESEKNYPHKNNRISQPNVLTESSSQNTKNIGESEKHNRSDQHHRFNTVTSEDQVASQARNREISSKNRQSSQQQEGDRTSQNDKSMQNPGKRFETQENEINNDRSPEKHKENSEVGKSQLDNQSQEIYLVEFFCKALHFILSCLGSKDKIVQTLSDLRKNDPVCSVEQFTAIVKGMVGEKINVMDFDVIEILEAIFGDQDPEANSVKFYQFSQCLYSYFNFLQLLVTKRVDVLSLLSSNERQVNQKLRAVKDINLNASFLWNEILPSVNDHVRQKINRMYKIGPSSRTPTEFILHDLDVISQEREQSSKLLLRDYILLLKDGCGETENIFLRVSADLGFLIKEEIENILMQMKIESRTIESEVKVLEENQQVENEEDQESFTINLTSFQALFKRLGIEISLWESMMIIEEVKIWQENLIPMGEGVISIQLVQTWFENLYLKSRIKGRAATGKVEAHRIESVKSLESDEEDLIDQINANPSRSPLSDSAQVGDQDALKLQENPSINMHVEKGKMTKLSSQVGSVRNSQINNDSDIANIANLLREQDNRFHMQTITENTIKPTGEVQIQTEENILKALESVSKRNIQAQEPYGDDSKSKQSSSEVEVVHRSDSELQTDQLKRQNLKSLFISCEIKSIKLKDQQRVVEVSGIKKIRLTLKRKQAYEVEGLSETNSYFLTEENLKEFCKSYEQENNQKSYTLSNIKIDGKKQDRLQIYYSALIFEMLTIQKDANNLKNKVEKENYQELMLYGMLPIEDISSCIQLFRNELESKTFFKKRTIILYRQKQIQGKLSLQVTVSESRLDSKIADKPLQLQELGFIFKNKKIFKNSEFFDFQHQISLGYCTKDDQKSVQLKVKVSQSQQCSVFIPTPIFEFTLLLRVERLQGSIKEVFDPSQSRDSRAEMMKNSVYSANGQQNQVGHGELYECCIPLSELCFKDSFKAEFPLINIQTGQFVTSFDVEICLKGKKGER